MDFQPRSMFVLLIYAPLFERSFADSPKLMSMSQEGRIAAVSLLCQIFRRARIIIELWSYVLVPVANCDLFHVNSSGHWDIKIKY